MNSRQSGVWREGGRLAREVWFPSVRCGALYLAPSCKQLILTICLLARHPRTITGIHEGIVNVLVVFTKALCIYVKITAIFVTALLTVL